MIPFSVVVVVYWVTGLAFLLYSFFALFDPFVRFLKRLTRYSEEDDELQCYIKNYVRQQKEDVKRQKELPPIDM